MLIGKLSYCEHVVDPPLCMLIDREFKTEQICVYVCVAKSVTQFFKHWLNRLKSVTFDFV